MGTGGPVWASSTRCVKLRSNGWAGPGTTNTRRPTFQAEKTGVTKWRALNLDQDKQYPQVGIGLGGYTWSSRSEAQTTANPAEHTQAGSRPHSTGDRDTDKSGFPVAARSPHGLVHLPAGTRGRAPPPVSGQSAAVGLASGRSSTHSRSGGS